MFSCISHKCFFKSLTKSFTWLEHSGLTLPVYKQYLNPWIHHHNFISVCSHAFPLSTSRKSLFVCWNTWSARGVLSGGAFPPLSNVSLFEQTRMFCKRFLNFGIRLCWLYQNRRLTRTVLFFLLRIFILFMCHLSCFAPHQEFHAQWLWTVFIFQWIDRRTRIALG